MTDASIIGAFSEDQVIKLTGLTRGQLSGWRRANFVRPSLQVDDNSRKPYTYLYSFKDLLKLRVLNQLRNVHGVMPVELKRVAAELEKTIGKDAWIKTRFWVLNRRVVFDEPETSRKREVYSKQFVAEIALAVVTTDAREAIRLLNERTDAQKGTFSKRRYFHSSSKVFAGTRIPVSSVQGYLRSNYSTQQILKEFPDLSPKDIEAARAALHDEAA